MPSARAAELRGLAFAGPARRRPRDYRSGAQNDPIARRYAMTMAALVAIRDGRSSLQIPEASLAQELGAIRYQFDDDGVASGWVQLPTITSW